MTNRAPSFSYVRRRDYDGIDAVNWSSLKAMRDSPLHYTHRRSNPRQDTPSMLLGRVVHTAILEPERLPVDVAVFTGPRRAGKVWDDFEAANASKDIVKEPEWEEACAIGRAVRSHPLATPYLSVQGQAEHTVQWTDAETGLRCKGRTDLLVTAGGERTLVDLKTARSVDSRLLGQQAAKLGYHCQLAFYFDGLEAAGLRPDKVVILAVESDAPNDVGVFVVTDDVLFAGREEYRVLLRRLAKCRETGEFNGRYLDEQELVLPAWVYADDESDDLGLVHEEE